MRFKTAITAVLVTLGLFAGRATGDQSKSYSITLGTVSKIGDAELAPGDYRFVMDGPKVRFTEVKTGRTFEVEAKFEEMDQKSDFTAVHSQRVDGTTRIVEIQISGSKTRISFQ